MLRHYADIFDDFSTDESMLTLRYFSMSPHALLSAATPMR